MSSVSDIVTPYDLPYQAKAALCNYVPKLRKTYNAQDLDDEHPIRLTNQAAKFDHSEERDYEFTWWVPRPGRGTNFWMPLRINPEQEDLLARPRIRGRESGRDTASTASEELGTTRHRRVPG